jgi:hypothetical protein
MDQISLQIEAREKISKIVISGQEKISELKLYFDSNNNKYYKEVIRLGPNLQKFENLFTKYEYRLRCENIISLAISLGKILDLNNSVKTILLAIKIFEEHTNYLRNKKRNDSKSFISKLFEKNGSMPLSQNEIIKERMKINYKNDSFKNMENFYNALINNDSNSAIDFTHYLAFQKDSKSKGNSNFKMEDFNNKLEKIMSDSYSNKFYSRIPTSFELDYPSIVHSACDVFFMLYNKMMDKICYNPNLISYINELDKYITNYFIDPCAKDLRKLSESIIQLEIKEINDNLAKFYY